MSYSAAPYLVAYIVDLTLVLYEISTMLTVDPSKSLSTDFVMEALATYKSRSFHIHAQLKEVDFTSELDEKKIEKVILDALPFQPQWPLRN